MMRNKEATLAFEKRLKQQKGEKFCSTPPKPVWDKEITTETEPPAQIVRPMKTYLTLFLSLIAFAAFAQAPAPPPPNAPASAPPQAPAAPNAAAPIQPPGMPPAAPVAGSPAPGAAVTATLSPPRSEEHTSELQSRFDLVCRLLLEKKKKNQHDDKINIY